MKDRLCNLGYGQRHTKMALRKLYSSGKMYFLPFHIGSGNRGCEAITRATAELINADRKSICVLTDSKRDDMRVGLHHCVNLQEIKIRDSIPVSFQWLLNYVRYCTGIDIVEMIQYWKFISQAKRDDIILITGGDLYCYPQVIWKLKWVVFLARLRRCRIILWGCSVEKDRLSQTLIRHFHKYDDIFVRESITLSNFEKSGIANVRLRIDPAFALKEESCSLPAGMEFTNVIGLNISNYVNGDSYATNTLLFKSVVCLIEYILNQSEAKILLIPHVFWENQDDRILLQKLYKKFEKSDNIFWLGSEKLSYTQIRFVISKCRFFIGARTHSMISAYSMCIPSLALGYSVKAKGIAKDLGLPEELVLDCREIRNTKELIRRYKYLEDHENEIIKVLRKRVQTYRQD